MAEEKAMGGAGTEAQMASQINGGGCLPPPTPRPQPKTLIELIGETMSKNNVAAYGQRKTAKGWESTTMRMMREGVGGAPPGLEVMSMEQHFPNTISDVSCHPQPECGPRAAKLCPVPSAMRASINMCCPCPRSMG